MLFIFTFILTNSFYSKNLFPENKPPRPKSLMFFPATKLISLEEAQARSRSGIVSPILDKISPSQTTVRMRDWGDKSSSERRSVFYNILTFSQKVGLS